MDTTPPSFSTSTTGSAGNTDWYLSDAITTVSASGALSGVDHVEYNQNSTGWQNGSSITSNDGNNSIAIRVYDIQLEGGIIRGAVGLSPVQPDVRHISYLDLDINLTGTWKFSIGDISDWKNPDYDDKDWEEIFVPAFWETQGFKNYHGFAWYRIKFNLPEKYAYQKMVLMLGMIDDIDQTFVNGTLIGSVGDWNFSIVPESFNQNNEWETIRAYYIPDNVLQPGKENTIRSKSL